MTTDKELDEFTNEFLAEEAEEVAQQEQAAQEKALELEAAKKETGEEGEVDSPAKEEVATNNQSDGSGLWDGTTEEQRSEIKALQDKLALAEHAANSDRGRNKALHAKVLKLEEEKAKAEADALAAAQAAQSQAKSPENSAGYTDEEISDMRKDLPEVEAIVSQETRDLKKQLEELQARMADSGSVSVEQHSEEADLQAQIQQQQAEQAAQAARNAEIAKVEQVHPNFMETINSIDYSTWLSRQPSGVQEMAKSPHADNAIAVINMFKGASASKSIDHELEAMTDIPHKGLTKSNLVDEDNFDAHFDNFSKELEAQR